MAHRLFSLGAGSRVWSTPYGLFPGTATIGGCLWKKAVKASAPTKEKYLIVTLQRTARK